ncbi:MAG TPA: AsmA family protein, partial [Stellaceae bacterium]|nr:AsmA family protein [Stellaceae bacterium]
MRALRIVGRAGAGVLIIIVLVLGALALGRGPVLAWLIEHPVSHLAGLPILVDGPVSIEWGNPTRLVAENIRIAGARWGARSDLFAARRAEIDIDPRAPLDGARPLPLVSIEHAILLLETAPDGRPNWDAARAVLDKAADGAWAGPRRIVVHDGTLIFGADSTERRLVADTLAIDMPGGAEPIELSATGAFRQQTIRVAARIGPLDQLRHPTHPYPIALEAHLGDSDLALRASAAAPLALAGIEATLSLSGRRFDQIATAFGLALPPLPELHADGELVGGDGDWAVRGLTVRLGRSDLEGGIKLSTHGRLTYARADLSSSLIDLDDLVGLIGALRSATSMPPTTEPGGRIIPAATIPLPRLPDMNVDINLHGKRVAGSRGPPLADVVVAFRLKDGVAALDPLTFGVAGGQVAVDMSVNPTPPVPELALGLDIRRVDLAELARRETLPRFAKEARGIAGGFLHVQGAGASLRDFVGRMEGEAGVFAEDGAFGPGLQQVVDHDVLDALGLDSGARTVPVNCLISRFSLKQGVVTASTLLLDTAATTLRGQGTVNFGAETVYVDLTPHHKQVTATTVSTPVEVRGTYAGVTIRPGTASIVERP